jgi:mannosylglycoprotein endo-beta-mannosidase
MEIYKGEESFWWQRSRQNWILKGDANTTYFHAIANGRRRKCSIPCLWDNDRLLEDNSDISAHTYSFYKELFTASPRSGVALAVDFWPLGARVTDDENVELTLPFLPEEVARAVRDMKANLALGSDGLTVSFF